MKSIIKTQSFIRLAILTVLHAVYVGFINQIIVGVLFVGYFLCPQFDIAFVFATTVCMMLPVIMGIMLVNRPKWWLISLPLQFLAGLGTLNVWKLNLGPMFFGESFRILEVPSSIGKAALLSLMFLAIQAIGVGIKALWLKWRAKKGNL